MTLAPTDLVDRGGVPTTVRLGMRGAEEMKNEFRPLTTELAREGEVCGWGQIGTGVA